MEHPLSIRALEKRFDALFPINAEPLKDGEKDGGTVERTLTFYGFFAGGGMARVGLGGGWRCVFAYDFDKMKARTYAANWGGDHFVCGDVADVTTAQLRGRADLTWASFPCQDLSLAGKYRGLGEASSEVMTLSGTFWPFWRLMTDLAAEDRASKLIVLENVIGAITSRDGRDFEAICNALSEAGYRYGAVVIDAKHFVPQSRPRLFFVAVAHVPLPVGMAQEADEFWHPAALRTAQALLRDKTKAQWHWWGLAKPPPRNIGFCDLIEERPAHCRWHSNAETEAVARDDDSPASNKDRPSSSSREAPRRWRL